MKIYPVILSGGSGSRLWPLSRKSRPKQFLPLISGRSMLQDTLGRIDDREKFHPPIVISSNDHRFIVAEQLDDMDIKPFDIILEPIGRNTAAAVAVAALRVASDDPDGLIVVLPADHHFDNAECLLNSIDVAKSAALRGKLVALGISPKSPHTGFGYIKGGDVVPDIEGASIVDMFVEKPSEERAQAMLSEGGWLWNGGIFIFPVQKIIAEINDYSSDLLNSCHDALTHANRDLDFTRLDEGSFLGAESVSIDIAVMEKTNDAVVVPVGGEWSDLGSWQSLWDAAEKDESGSVVRGDVVGIDIKQSYIHSSDRLVTAIGIKDMIVIVDKDAILVADKARSESVKEMVSLLKDRGYSQAEEHHVNYRPWGSFCSIDIGNRFQVKRITVSPKSSLSLQRHQHRSEHWIVVTGTAKVTCDDKVFIMTHDQSTYIPQGSIHRLENIGEEPLELIEVQTGGYLGEDDIERFSDIYGRVES